MKIEKRKVLGKKPFSATATSAIAATLGITGVWTLNACDDSSSPTSGQVVEPIPDSVNSPETPNSSSQVDAIPGSSSQVENAPSSSSSSVNIPLSHEPVSSSLMDAISSALESSSSAAEPISFTIEPASSADAPVSSSDTAAPATSSETEQLSSSSATVVPATSSETVTPSSSSSNPWGIDPFIDPCDGVPDGTSVEYGGRLYLCPNSSSSGGGMMFSMISTFERTDIET